ncbi:family 43 glycosylhydrolase [Kineococcus sp. TBRC 1896]|uniref:Family 43 glycosylhydrolase n=1 Tax=Kineococcus mangrovi TaxID=1660183 RepID=A0ABV4I4L9_9ACTN
MNPVLAGSHPDPSICRVGADYYLVTSSFAYFPAVPVHHSRDLLTWELIGHVVTDPAHLRCGESDFADTDCSDGVWAPTIRHHEGVFYVVLALARQRRGAATVLFTATDPRGPWSAPVQLEADGIDPSLFIDDDGTCWFAAARDATVQTATGPAEIYVRRLDLQSLSLVGPETVIWHGAMAGAWAEAPHLTKRDGVYHLLAAEGGTERRHSVTAARAEVVTGPWRTDPRSPLLTHRHLSPDHPVQNVGHADLVDDEEGRTWAVVLGVRPVRGVHTLGREIFLVPVDWSPDGPVFAPGTGMVTGVAPDTAAAAAVTAAAASPTSGATSVDGAWSSIALSGREVFSLRGPLDVRPEPGGAAALPVVPATLSAATGTPGFLGWPQRDLHFQAEIRCRAANLPTMTRAGLALFVTPRVWAAAVVETGDDGTVRFQIDTGDDIDSSPGGDLVEGVGEDLDGGPGSGVAVHQMVDVDGDHVVIRVDGDEEAYRFSWTLAAPEDHTQGRGGRHEVWRPLGVVPRRALSNEVAGDFLGVHLGPYASGCEGAAFVVDRFRYRATGAMRTEIVPAVPAVPVVSTQR